MKEHSFWEALKAIVGGTPQEVVGKGVLALVTLIVAAVRDASWFAMAFLIVIGIDAILGTVLSLKRDIKIKAWRWVTGPLLKAVVMVLFLVMAAIFDMIISKTPVQHMSSSPLVITATVVGVGAAIWEAAGKLNELTGINIKDWMGPLFDRFKK